MMIKDQYGRLFRKLRVSLLDTCNYRCTYCMPENVKFNDQGILSSTQLFDTVSRLVPFGLEEIRLTGGEPCLRKDIIDIVELLSSLKLKSLGLTTNAHFLEDKLVDLEKTNLSSINISLDSLNREKFKRITKVDGLEKVLSAIFKAQELGFKVKINTVLMNNINHDELLDFVDFSVKNKIEVRFLEVMKIGVMKDRFDDYFIPAKKMIDSIKKTHPMKFIPVAVDSTAFKYQVGAGQIGFIASESMPFCGHCSRLRLSSKGELRSCLMKNNGIKVTDLSKQEIAASLQVLINEKPYERIESIDQPMYEIGG